MPAAAQPPGAPEASHPRPIGSRAADADPELELVTAPVSASGTQDPTGVAAGDQHPGGPGAVGADRRAVWTLTALFLLPLAILAARALFQSWVPLGDQATIALRVLEVGTSHTPLVGVYSRFGWSHPGPLFFYALALTYRLTFDRTDGLLLGVVLINALALVLIPWAFVRRGGITLAALGVACFGFALWTLGASFLWYPWNPTAALLPFAAALALTFAVSCGSARAIPVLAAVASFLVQTHVEYAPAAVGLAVCAVVGYWRAHAAPLDPPEQRRSEPLRVSLLVTGAVLVVAWFPPVLDALLHRGGNLRALLRFGFSSHQTLGLSTAVKIMSDEVSLRGPWLGFHEPVSGIFQGGVAPLGTPVPAGLILLLAATAVAAWRHDRLALRLCLIVLVTLGLATLSVSNIVGTPYPYLIYFVRVVAAATWLAAIWTFLRALPDASGYAWRVVIPTVSVAAAVTVAVLLTVSAAIAGIGPTADLASSEALAHVMPAVLRTVDHRSGTVLVDASASFGGTGYRSGLLYQLAHRGIAARASAANTFMYGSHYTDVGQPAVTLLVAVDDAEIAAARHQGAHLLAEYRQPPPYPPLTPPIHVAVFEVGAPAH